MTRKSYKNFRISKIVRVTKNVLKHGIVYKFVLISKNVHVKNIVRFSKKGHGSKNLIVQKTYLFQKK